MVLKPIFLQVQKLMRKIFEFIETQNNAQRKIRDYNSSELSILLLLLLLEIWHCQIIKQ